MAANFVIVDGLIGAPSPASATDTVAKWPLGYLAHGVDYNSASGNTASTNCGAGMFVYVRGSNVSSAGQWCSLRDNYAVIATTPANGVVGVAAGPLSATSLYGWVQVQGKLDYGRGTDSTGATGAAMYLGSVVGVVNSVYVAGGRVLGANFATEYSTASSNSAHYFLQFPTVQAILT